MAKGVLGNDPFKRGAADRSAETERAPEAMRPAAEPQMPAVDAPAEKPHVRAKQESPLEATDKASHIGAKQQPLRHAPDTEPAKTQIEAKQKPVRHSPDTESAKTQIEAKQKPVRHSPDTKPAKTKIEARQKPLLQSPDREPEKTRIATKKQPAFLSSPDREPQKTRIATKRQPSFLNSPDKEPQKTRIEKKQQPSPPLPSPDKEPQKTRIENRQQPGSALQPPDTEPRTTRIENRQQPGSALPPPDNEPRTTRIENRQQPGSALHPPDAEPRTTRIKNKAQRSSSLPPPDNKPRDTRIEAKQQPSPPILEREEVTAPTSRKLEVAAPARAERIAAREEIVDESGARVAARALPSGEAQAETSLQKSATAMLSTAVRTISGIVQAVRTGLGAAGAVDVDAYGRDPEPGRALAPVTGFLYERYWRVQVTGAERIPNGPCILVANHSGALPFDGPVLHAALKRERPDLNDSRWLLEDQVFYAPVVGMLLNRLGAVRANPENALRLLGEMRPVIVFPEGIQGLQKPFAERYQLKRFGRGGFVKLSLQSGAPIVPVAIIGADESSPLLGRLPTTLFGVPYLPLTSPIPLPARWHLRIGAPFTVDDLRATGEEEAVRVQRGTELTREAIQGMLETLLRDRGPTF